MFTLCRRRMADKMVTGICRDDLAICEASYAVCRKNINAYKIPRSLGKETLYDLFKLLFMKSNLTYALTSVSILLLFFVSCKKENPGQHEFPGKEGYEKTFKKVRVSNLTELYVAINDPSNTNSQIELSPGTYTLSPDYPNAGRLELLENMVLVGKPGHEEAVIIDASALPGTSFTPPNNFPTGRTGAIRMGKGYNAIEWLTVKGNASAQALSAIETDIISQAVAQVKIAHVKVSGARIGIDLRNGGTASAGRTLEAELEENEITENLVQFGQGLEIQNANGASGAIIRAELHGNYVHGNKLGLRAFNNNANGTNTNDGLITIQSYSDRFEENGVGVFLGAGLSQLLSTTGANNNSLSFEAHATTIKNNLGELPPENEPNCGIYAVGGLSITGGSTSNNTLSVKLWSCPFSNNNGADIIAFGALSNSAIPAGTDNTAEIFLEGVSKKASVTATASMPVEPAGTNVVNIIR